MTGIQRDEARTLIVVSRDHGEFGFAMSLLRGQEFAARATLALPHSHYAANKTDLPVRAVPYATLGDILCVVDAQKPDLVFLLCGYLLSNDGLASPEEVQAFVHQLRDRGCRVVTSDPFLGLASRLTFAQVDIRAMSAEATTLLSRWRLRIGKQRPARDQEVLRVPNLEDAVHLYPASAPKDVPGSRVLRLSFFNPAIISAVRKVPVAREGRDQGNWLFVVSSTDVECQRILTGLGKFRRCMTRLLRSAVAAGRLPTLIAPPSLVTALSSKVPDLVELLPFCPFAEFQNRLLEAEYVFYWNAFSFSHQARLANELPLFLFDRGHLTHLATWVRDSASLKPFFQVALACYFGGWEPTHLDQTQRLDPGGLADLADQQRPAIRAVLERWQSLPTPDEVVQRLMHERA